MQYWITVLNLSGWKVHFITLQLEFFNFLSLSSGKPECFAILAAELDINLKKPYFLEGSTRGSLTFALVSTCFRHSHLSPGRFSCMQSLAEVNPIPLFHGFLKSPQCWFFYQHFSLSLSASPLQCHLYQLCLLLVERVQGLQSSLMFVSLLKGQAPICNGKRLCLNLGHLFKLWAACPRCLELSVYPLRARERVVQGFCRAPRVTNQSPPVDRCLSYASRNIRISLLMSINIPWPNTSPVFAGSVPDPQPLPCSGITLMKPGYQLVMWQMTHTTLSFPPGFLL